MAIFSLIVSSMTSLVMGSFTGLEQGGEHTQAEFLAQEAMEAVRSIRDRAWNEIIYSQSGVSTSSGQWSFSGASTTEQKGQFTRTISFSDVCRDSSDDITVCPGSYTDIHSKEVDIIVEWEVREGISNSVQRSAFLTNWDSEDWTEDSEVDFADDEFINTEISPTLGDGDGAVVLESSEEGCTGYTWSFNTPAAYSYDSDKIEVVSSIAQLKLGDEQCTGTAVACDSFLSTTTCLSQGGCLWDTENCAGSPSDCSGLGEGVCDKCGCTSGGSYCSGSCRCLFWPCGRSACQCDDMGCSWWMGICYGSCDCSQATSQNCCENYVHGCSWHSSSCSGQPSDCDSYSIEDDCSDCGCDWDAADCYGTASTCDSFTASTTCAAQQGCSWNQGTYSINRPTINPNSPYNPSSIDSWTTFTETATKADGEIYYQISDENPAVNWYYWDGSDWSLAGSGDYNTAEVINENLWKFDVADRKFTFKAFLESDGTQQVQLDEISVGCANLQLEAGRVSTDENWTEVSLDNTYESPVVVTSYYESSNTLPASTRIRNLDEDSFEIRLQNPGDSSLYSDEITYFVIEEGNWEMDGVKLEVEKYDTDTVGCKSSWDYDVKNFTQAFSSGPIVLHQVMTYNDPEWISTYVSRDDSRTDPPDTNGMRIALNGAEAATSHATETIGWIAIERDEVGAVNGVDFETYRTSDSVRGHDNGCYDFNYQNSYDSAPLVLGFQLEMDGSDGGWLVTCDNNATSQAGFHVEEDQEQNSERNHVNETSALMAFAQSFSYSSGGQGGYATSGSVTSDSFNMGTSSRAVQIIKWGETIPECASCDILLQIRTATSEANLSLSEWSGPEGPSGYYDDFRGGLILAEYNGNNWVQYKAVLTSDGTDTPVLEEVKINYK